MASLIIVNNCKIKQRFGAVFYYIDVPILTPTVGLTFIELQAERNKQVRSTVAKIFIIDPKVKSRLF